MQVAVAAQSAKRKKRKLPVAVTSEKVKAYLLSKGRKGHGTPTTYGQGMVMFQRFLVEKLPAYDVDTILDASKANKILDSDGKTIIDIYAVLDKFVAHLVDLGYAPGAIRPWTEGVKGYCNKYDVDIVPHKFKNKVTMPTNNKEDEYAPSREEMRTLLLGISNRRMKTYCNFLRMGPRAVEGLAVRACDISFKTRPTKIYMRAEYSKNGLPRDIYLIDEVDSLFRQWWIRKYGSLDKMPDNQEDLFFAVGEDATPDGMYSNMAIEFRSVLKAVGMGKRRKRGRQSRYDITLHSFRRWAETVIEDHTSENFANYILGHKKSPYYNHPEMERREIFAEQCAPHMTLFNYNELEQTIKEKDHQIRQTESMLTSRMDELERDHKIWKEMVASDPSLMNKYFEALHKRASR